MDRVLSVEEIPNPYWQLPPPHIEDPNMNRTESEWDFERFLQEVDPTALPSLIYSSSSYQSSHFSDINGMPVVDKEVFERKKPSLHLNPSHLPPPPPPLSPDSSSDPPHVPVDSNEVQAVLKRNLELACAAVALTRASAVKPQDSASLVENVSQISDVIPSGPQAPGKGPGCSFSYESDKAVAAPLGIPALSAMQNKPGFQTWPATSASSRESDDEDLEGDAEITDNMDPADVKRVRRMLSNRESARRSRRRKQAHMNELEAQISQLRVEKSSSLQRLTDISHKHKEAADGNRILKADVETLRAKVKMAEQTVKRVTGLNPLLQGLSEMPNKGMPFNGSPSYKSVEASAPVRGSQKQHFYQQASNNSLNDRDVSNGLPDVPPIPRMEEVRDTTGGNSIGQKPSK